MFHPQPTPYVSSTYNDVFFGFRPTGLRVERSSPSILREPVFAPVVALKLPTALNTTNISSHRDMAADGVSDVEAQELLARTFQANLIVRCTTMLPHLDNIADL